ncbi:member of major facilitator superfamilymultidrug-dha1 sub-family [Lichtheimia corymbifera JMRC:FSU:9682]|uniref:Member of major facilitator superfamilymultidrug-dha1 sub-family n=1 Tax=Lichtheimia corymbifera JMRC:FSU:9682 TaxID=1263082 RepID=A0A068S0C9_9FUNG|nr:member of major facilitator superfamilymultidrug-dha1 sub-family [Lichtheimia corymbifera JMRC:FSU:9682]
MITPPSATAVTTTATQERPLPYRQLLILCGCRFSEPISFTVILPFIIFMIRDFDITEEKNVGYYAGMITSAFAMAQLMTGISWGMLSDRIGRRPVILMGTAGAMTSILLFGLSKSFAWALISRSLCGLLNGNVGVLKSMVSEITIHNSEEQRARAFTYLPLIYGLGSIIGPAMGGLLSNPVRNFPSIFGRGGFITDFFTEYPYFLPCFISAMICAISLTFGYFYLDETLSTVMKKEEEEPLIQNNPSDDGYRTFEENQRLSASSPTPTLPDESRPPPTFREAITPAVLAISISYALFSFQAIYYDELFPIWSASPRNNGGLGYRADEIGIALAYCGIVTLILQLFFLPKLTARFGVLRLYRFVLAGCIPLYFMQGYVRWFYEIPDLHGARQTKFWVWVGILVTATFRTCYHSISYTACTILVNNGAKRLNTLGTVNGFAQCCGSAMRALGPATCGMIWSASLGASWLPYDIRVHISWTVLTLVGILTYYSSTRLNPADYEKSKFVSREDEIAQDDEACVTHR